MYSKSQEECNEAASREVHAVLQVTSAINNLIMGKIYIEHTGIMRISNLQSSLVAKIKFKETGRLSSKDAHQVCSPTQLLGVWAPT